MTIHDHSTRPVPPSWTPPAPPAPEADKSPRGAKNGKLAVAGALVAVAVASAGVTAGVMAATSSTSSSTAAAGGPGGGPGGMGGGPGGMSGAASSLHGTSVVSDGNGGYTTQLTQTGTVSAVSASAITVKSEDGFSQTYVISSSTTVDNGADQITDVATGHTVRVVATGSTDSATATTITDTNLASTDTGGMPGGQGAPPGN
jgi:hypothetical protein